MAEATEWVIYWRQQAEFNGAALEDVRAERDALAEALREIAERCRGRDSTTRRIALAALDKLGED